MTTHSTSPGQAATEAALFSGQSWFDPVEEAVRAQMRGFIEAMIETELDQTLRRQRYKRRPAADPESSPPESSSDEPAAAALGHRHGHRKRTLLGSFGPVELSVPRARLHAGDGAASEWKSQSLQSYQRRTRQAEALIAGANLAGTNTRRVKRALGALFKGAVGKDVVSRAWRKVQTDWEAWCKRDLSGEPIVRLILDGTVVRTRIDKKSTSISLLVALGVRADGQKILLAVNDMGGESEASWRAFLDDLSARGLRQPEFVIVDGAPGLEKALAGLWPNAPVQRCTVHKHRNLLAHAPEKLHDEIWADYTDLIYAKTAKEAMAKRRLFIAKWRLKHRPVADSFEEAGDRLFTFLRCPPNNGRAREPATRSSACTRNSSAASKPRRCCLPRKPPPCCSGR